MKLKIYLKNNSVINKLNAKIKIDSKDSIFKDTDA